VKAVVPGNGGAGKAQVTAMVTKILGLQAKPAPADAADALALVIYHYCDDRKSEVSHLRSETHAPHGALS
jgi:Holliday junction resolvasome RuvABC endonuclease subunit